ncbi:hypothetical protein [Achromobacter phage Motura]|uniref:Uncharacterized protein n=1 Tax=Achromobacter phage Motura TaxID=2591403 RepID=A0A514CTB4_9CAUD|nr:hypothetical protein H1O15_gp124 [Achromobacter phage Motura]QDH83704.1 hypothetical protein [Achromobacter phage Motura]
MADIDGKVLSPQFIVLENETVNTVTSEAVSDDLTIPTLANTKASAVGRQVLVTTLPNISSAAMEYLENDDSFVPLSDTAATSVGRQILVRIAAQPEVRNVAADFVMDDEYPATMAVAAKVLSPQYILMPPADISSFNVSSEFLEDGPDERDASSVTAEFLSDEPFDTDARVTSEFIMDDLGIKFQSQKVIWFTNMR